MLTLLCVAAVVQPLDGQGSEPPDETPAPYLVPRTDGTIVLDGRPDEAAWELAEPLLPVGHLPTFGGAPSERSEFRLVHDGENLYFSCWMYDSEPDLIRAVSLRRNETGFTSDRCAILLDTANDEENALGFYTSPAGVRSDYAYSNDGGAVNPDWNTFWDVASSQDEHGWYAEFRIPFSSLLFQAVEGRVTMGTSMLRNIARKNERVLFPAISPEWSRGHGKSSLMHKIVLEGVQRSNPVYVTPYSLLGGGYAHTLDEAGTAYLRREERVREAGLDVRYGIGSNLTMDLTLNTDFAQVEADAQQINLTRFSLFFPEKRRFFQERGAVFEVPLGRQDRLFHSRRIGLVEGEPVRILGGGRLVGRIGEWDIGLLDMQTAESDLVPAENLGVLRLRRRFLNDNSYAGALLTSRIGSDGSRNTVYGLDGIVRASERDYVVLNWAESFESGYRPAVRGEDMLDRGLLRLNWERRGQDGFSHAIDLSRAGSRFEPRLGFLQRRDYSKADAVFGYGWRPAAESALLRYAVAVDATVFARNADRTVQSAEIRPSATMDLKSGHGLNVSLPVRYEDLRQAFLLPGGVDVPAGRHRFAGLNLSYGAPQGAIFKAGGSVEAGQFYDGWQASIDFGPSWNPSRHLTLDGTYRVDRVSFPDRNTGFTAHTVRLRTEVMFSTRLSTLTFVQYNSTAAVFAANFQLRYNPREGNDFYLVWNEGMVTEPERFQPNPPRSERRKILLKYAHTFALSF